MTYADFRGKGRVKDRRYGTGKWKAHNKKLVNKVNSSPMIKIIKSK